VYLDILLSVQPLMVLPFRLFMTFETSRRQQRQAAARDAESSSAGAGANALYRAQSVATDDAPVHVALQQVRACSSSSLLAKKTTLTQILPDQCRALYDNFEPDTDELFYCEGDVLVVEGRVNADWFLCSRKGATGLVRVGERWRHFLFRNNRRFPLTLRLQVPTNFVKLLDPNEVVALT
jgi:hypothetical protein